MLRKMSKNVLAWLVTASTICGVAHINTTTVNADSNDVIQYITIDDNQKCWINGGSEEFRGCQVTGGNLHIDFSLLESQAITLKVTNSYRKTVYYYGDTTLSDSDFYLVHTTFSTGSDIPVYVTTAGNITGGVYNALVHNYGTISGGSFNEYKVEEGLNSESKITGGLFEWMPTGKATTNIYAIHSSGAKVSGVSYDDSSANAPVYAASGTTVYMDADGYTPNLSDIEWSVDTSPSLFNDKTTLEAATTPSVSFTMPSGAVSISADVEDKASINGSTAGSYTTYNLTYGYGSATYNYNITGTASFHTATSEITWSSEDGAVKVAPGLNAGTYGATLVASNGINDVYEHITINVAKSDQAFDQSFKESYYWKLGSGTYSKPALLTMGSGSVYYTSSDMYVAQVDYKGEVTVIGSVGQTAVIKAHCNGDSNNNEMAPGDNDISYVLTIIKADQNVSTDHFQPVTKTIGDAKFTQTITGQNLCGAIKYAASDLSGTNVATVDENTGEVTITGAGTAKISASVVGDDTHSDVYEWYVLTVNQGDTVLSTDKFKDVTKTYGDDAFTQTAKITTGDGSIKYSSSDPTVATVDELSGKVTIVGAGNTEIRATVEDTDNYTGTYASYALTVNAAEQEVNTASFIDQTKTYGDDDFTQALTLTKGDGGITYSSANESIATVDANGKVKIVGTGSTTIRAAVAATSKYNAASAEYNLIVSKADQEFDTAKFVNTTKTIGDEDFTQTVTLTKGDGKISYASTNETVATIASDGTVKILAPGSATLIAFADGSDHYNTASTQCKLTVEKQKTSILNGDGKTVTKDNVPSEGITVRFEAEVKGVTQVLVDGKIIREGIDYNLESGSTIVKLTKSYLDTLPIGDYTLEVDYGDTMYGQSTFTVKPASVTDTSVTNTTTNTSSKSNGSSNSSSSKKSSGYYSGAKTADTTSFAGWFTLLIASLGILLAGRKLKEREN